MCSDNDLDTDLDSGKPSEEEEYNEELAQGEPKEEKSEEPLEGNPRAHNGCHLNARGHWLEPNLAPISPHVWMNEDNTMAADFMADSGAGQIRVLHEIAICLEKAMCKQAATARF